MDTDKASDKIFSWRSTLNKLGIENFLNLITDICEESVANIMLNSERLDALPVSIEIFMCFLCFFYFIVILH